MGEETKVKFYLSPRMFEEAERLAEQGVGAPNTVPLTVDELCEWVTLRYLEGKRKMFVDQKCRSLTEEEVNAALAARENDNG